jgi:hypothetical protein
VGATEKAIDGAVMGVFVTDAAVPGDAVVPPVAGDPAVVPADDDPDEPEEDPLAPPKSPLNRLPMPLFPKREESPPKSPPDEFPPKSDPMPLSTLPPPFPPPKSEEIMPPTPEDPPPEVRMPGSEKVEAGAGFVAYVGTYEASPK